MDYKICEFCNKQFATKQSCNVHKQNCKLKEKCFQYEEQQKKIILLEQENNTLKKELELLKNIIENQAKQPTKQINNTQNNNITINTSQSLKDLINNLEPIDFEEIKIAFENDYCERDIDKGIEGLATFICDGPCQNKLITTDFSRKLISYKTSPQQVISDPQGKLLVSTALKQSAQTLMKKSDERYKYWDNKIKNCDINDDVEFEQNNKFQASRVYKMTASAKNEQPIEPKKWKKASDVIIMKGLENKNKNVNAIE
jgi:hypothetical protein